jgi:hypothetical protein
MVRVARVSLLAAFLVSCAGTVHVSDAGNGVKAPPKPKDCAMPILRTKAPDRPYDEMAALHFGGSGLNQAGDPADAEQALREKACELGADALVATREFVPGVAGGKGRSPSMAATAIKFRAAGAPAAPPK